MEVFQRAKAVRLKSCHDKYLTADEDKESVVQGRRGSTNSAKWAVEFVTDGVIRLKSCYGKYLTASNQPFLLGMTGRKVLQTDPPDRLGSSVEWEPVLDSGAVKLRTRHGQFLRANGGVPPWRNSVTHDVPQRTVTQELILWEVHVVEILEVRSPSAGPAPPLPVEAAESFGSATSPAESSKSTSFTRRESNDHMFCSPPKGNEGRLIYFHIADENGKVEEGYEELYITFKGNKVDELTTRIEEEFDVHGITVCTRSPLNSQLCPLRLQLPPNSAAMHVIVVPSSSSLSPSPSSSDAIVGGHEKSLHETAMAIPVL